MVKRAGDFYLSFTIQQLNKPVVMKYLLCVSKSSEIPIFKEKEIRKLKSLRMKVPVPNGPIALYNP